MRVAPARSDIAPSASSYLVSMRLAPDYSAARSATTREARKVAAYEALRDAEAVTSAQLLPKLEGLRDAGVVDGWEFLPLTGALVVNAPLTRDQALFDALKGMDLLDNVVRNRWTELAPGPEVPKPNHSGGPASHGETPAWQPLTIKADAAWREGVTGRGVTIGFVDSGADANHEAIRDRYRGWRANGANVDDHNFFDFMDPAQTALHDRWGHGTNTASMAVGGGPRQVGVAPGANFISARAFGGGITDLATKLRAMAWMLAPTDSRGEHADPTLAPDVVNMSFGSRDAEGLRFADVLDAYEAAGIVAVAAAGNTGRRGPASVLLPAGFATTLAVGFTDQRDQLDPKTAIGPGPVPGRDGLPIAKPDVVAPGTNVVGADRGAGYAEFTGSSMSSAVVSGVVALLLEKYPQLTPAQVRAAITSSAVDIGDPGFDARAGHGRVDVEAALRRAGELVR